MEILEVFMNYRRLSKFDKEIQCIVNLFYFGIHTLRKQQTLGEEYCYMVPRNKMSAERFASNRSVITYGVCSVLLPYLIQKLGVKYQERLNRYVYEKN